MSAMKDYLLDALTAEHLPDEVADYLAEVHDPFAWLQALASDLDALDALILEISPRMGREDAERLEAFRQRYWPAAREAVVVAERHALRGRIGAARQRLLAAEDWTLIDEGTWEEHVRPGGCNYYDIAALREYAADLERKAR